MRSTLVFGLVASVAHAAVAHGAKRDDLLSLMTELAQYSTMSLDFGDFDTASYMSELATFSFDSASYMSALGQLSININGITLFFGRPDVSSAYAALETINTDNTRAIVAWASSFYDKYLKELNTLYDSTALSNFLGNTGTNLATARGSLSGTPSATASGSTATTSGSSGSKASSSGSGASGSAPKSVSGSALSTLNGSSSSGSSSGSSAGSSASSSSRVTSSASAAASGSTLGTSSSALSTTGGNGAANNRPLVALGAALGGLPLLLL